MNRASNSIVHSIDAASTSSYTQGVYAASFPTNTGRLKSYPVPVPGNSGTYLTTPPSSPVDGIDTISHVVAPRRSLSISIGDSGASRHRYDSTSSSSTYHHHLPPPMVIRSRRCSFSTSSLTLHSSKIRPKGAATPPKRSLWQLIRNNAIQFGLEFCYATETAMVTPILLQLGLPTNLYGIAFLIAPIFGFLMNPLIGSTSDGCLCSWGRRRPFILALGIGTLVGVSFYLNGGDLGALIESGKANDNLWGIIITLIGVVILDVSADSSDGPSRSYLIDVCDLEDINIGLNLRAVLGGIGGGLGYISNGIDWTTTALAAVLGSQLRVVFLFNIVIYFTCLVLNLTSIPETPLKNGSKFDVVTECRVTVDKTDKNFNEDYFDERSPLITTNGSVNVEHNTSTKQSSKKSKAGSQRSVSNSLNKNSNSAPPKRTSSRVSQRDSSVSFSDLPQIKEESSTDEDEEQASVLALLRSIIHMPTELRRLCFTHYLGWAGMVTVLLFFTNFVGQAVYNGNPTSPEGSENYKAYHMGVKMGCWGMAVFAFSSSVSAIFYMKVDSVLSHRTLYVFGQLSFAMGAGFMALLTDYVYGILVLCFTFGVQFTTLMTVPFNILASFHDCEAYKNPKGGMKRGLGTDVACMCCQLFLAQITVSAIMGPLISALGSQLVVVMFASLMGFLASFSSAVFVIYTPIIKEDKNIIQEIC